MFINETPFDDALIKEMGKRYHLTIIRFTVFLSVLLLALGIINFIQQKQIAGIIFTILSPLILLIFHLIIPLVIKLRTAPDAATKAAVAGGYVQTITFYDEHFTITTTASDDVIVRNNYSAINKVIQTRKFIIFDITVEDDGQNVSLGILKSGMRVGSASDLYNFLLTQLERNKRQA